MAASRLEAFSLFEGEAHLGVFGFVNDRSSCGFEARSSRLAEAVEKDCGGHPAFRRTNQDGAFGVHFAGEVF
jgi:hypothetical protein